MSYVDFSQNVIEEVKGFCRDKGALLVHDGDDQVENYLAQFGIRSTSVGRVGLSTPASRYVVFTPKAFSIHKERMVSVFKAEEVARETVQRLRAKSDLFEELVESEKEIADAMGYAISAIERTLDDLKGSWWKRWIFKWRISVLEKNLESIYNDHSGLKRRMEKRDEETMHDIIAERW